MSQKRMLLLLMLAALAFGLYANTLQHEFVNFDDPDLVARNPYIKTLSFANLRAIFTPGVVGAYQPLRTLSYALDYHFWQLNPLGYHLTNILCHVVNTMLVALLAYALTQHTLLMFLAGALFAVHPIHVEAVAWVAGRRDVLATCFALAAANCFLAFRSQRAAGVPPVKTALFYASSLLLFTAGMLTKPSVVIIPVIFVLVEVCFPDPKSSRWRLVATHLPFFTIAALLTSVFMHVSQASGVIKTALPDAVSAHRLLMMLRVFAEYVYLLIAPRGLSATYGLKPVVSLWTPSVLIALVVLSVIAFFMLLAWERAKFVCFGLAWFWIALLPVSNIIPIAIVKADRYLYLPSVGVCLAAAWLLVAGQTALRRVSAARGLNGLYWLLIGVILTSYAALTVRRNQDWRDSETLWSATLETNPDSSIALNNLGLIYAARGLTEQAIILYEQLIDAHPDQEHLERVFANLADAYAAQGATDDAMTNYEQALELDPAYIPAYLGLGRLTLKLGDAANARQIYLHAAEINPQDETVYEHLGNLAVVQGQYDEARAQFQHALQLNPYALNAANGLGMSYAGQGEPDKAVALFQQVLQQQPDAAVIRNSLAMLYMERGKTDQAMAEFLTILQQEPANVDARNNLGMLYLHAQRFAEAVAQFAEIVAVQPDNAKAWSNLGLAYGSVGLPARALEAFQIAVAIDPTLLQTYVLMGDLCFQGQQAECAVNAYQQALKLSPAQPDLLKKLAAAQALVP